jgi:sugar phosphate isomerase/epimerase
MKIGICANLPAPGNAPAKPDIISLAAKIGYDYVELPLAPIADLDDGGYEYVKQKLADANIKCECCNIFFPARIRLTGESRDEAAVGEYIDTALRRAGGLGVKIVVFGSSGARNVPEGYPYETAFAQIADTLKTASAAAKKYGVQIAIESLNRGESNIIVSLSDAERLMKAADRDNVKILFDYYHFALESDSADLLGRLTRDNNIIHTHFADPEKRAYPEEAKPAFVDIFKVLRGAGYDSRCSLEAGLKNPDSPGAEMETALTVMKQLAGK